jgi:hypothetical protein
MFDKMNKFRILWMPVLSVIAILAHQEFNYLFDGKYDGNTEQVVDVSVQGEEIEKVKQLEAGERSRGYFVYFILLMFAVGISSLTKSLIGLIAQEKVLCDVEDALKRVDRAKIHDNKLNCVIPWLSSEEVKSSSSFIVQRVESLHLRAVRGLEPDLDSLREADELQLDDGLAMPRQLTDWSVLVGLLGTLYGLGVTIERIISGATQNNQLENTAELQKAVLHGLGGASTAFVTSMAGIACMLMLAFAAHNVHTYWTRVLDRFNRFVETDLLAFLFPKGSDNQLQDLLGKLEYTLGGLEGKIVMLDKSVMGIQGGVAGFLTAGSSFEKSADEFKALRSDINSLMTKSFEVQRSFGLKNDALVSRLEEMSNTTDIALSSIKEDLIKREEFSEQLAVSSSGLHEVAKQMQDLPAGVHREVQNLVVNNIVQFEAQLISLTDAYLTRMGPTGDKLVDVATSFDTSSQRLNELIQGLDAHTQEMSKSSKAVMDALNETSSRSLKQLVDSLGEHAQDLTQSSQDILSSLKGEIGQLAEEVQAGVLSQCRELNSTVEEDLQRLISSQRSSVDGLTSSLGEILGTLKKLESNRY